MNQVNLHVTDDITLGVHHLRGRFEPAGRAEIPYLDDKNSYVVVIDSGEIALDMPSLNAMMAQTLGQDHSNVEKVQITIDEDHQLQQKGVLDKGIPLPFNVKGGIEATPDGRLRMHAAKVKGLGVPVNPLMKLFSIEMDDLVKVKPGHGVTVDGNDLILDPQMLLPPPLIRGKVTAVRVEDAAIVLSFGSGERVRMSPPRGVKALHLLARRRAPVRQAPDDQHRPRAGGRRRRRSVRLLGRTLERPARGGLFEDDGEPRASRPTCPTTTISEVRSGK